MNRPREQLVERIADLLRDIMRGLHRGHGESIPHPDITIGQLHCLKTIRALGAPSMTELSDSLQLQPSTVTGLVDGLVEHGLVERREDEEDRRLVRVALTDHGKRRGDRHGKARRRRLMDLLTDIDDKELARIERALEVLHAAAAHRSEQALEDDGHHPQGDEE